MENERTDTQGDKPPKNLEEVKIVSFNDNPVEAKTS